MEAIPAFVVRTSNSIGSGDVFAGAFAARLALGDSPTLASTWGCAAAAKALREGSSSGSMPVGPGDEPSEKS